MFQSVKLIIISFHNFLMEQSVPISSNTFLGDPLSKTPPPFFKKGPPKITEGGTFDPHWPISKINPAFCLPVPTLVLQSSPPPPPPPAPQVYYFPHTSLSVPMQALLSLWTSLFGFALGS